MGAMHGGELAVRALEREGVRVGFSVSGGAINPLYHALRDNPIRLIHARHEAAAVARNLGIPLPYPDPVEMMRANVRRAGRAKASMLQDIERGRRTEIEYINGVIVREGERLGIAAPVNRTLADLIAAIEHRLGRAPRA